MSRSTKLLLTVLTLALLSALLLLPATAFADNSQIEIYVDGVRDYDAAYEVLDMLNAERRALGLHELTMNTELLEAAMQRAAEISVYYSHTRPNGTDCSTIINGHNYNRYDYSYGENIAIGQTTPLMVHNAWMNSDGHRENILRSSFTHVGIGCYINAGECHWVQFFGRNYYSANAPYSTYNGAVPTAAPVTLYKANIFPYLSLSNRTDVLEPCTLPEMTLQEGESIDYLVCIPNTSESVYPYFISILHGKSLTVTSSNPNTLELTGSGFTAKTKGTSTTLTISINNTGHTYYLPIKVIPAVETPVVTASINTSTGKPTFSWDTIYNAEKYEIWRSTSYDGPYTKLWTTSSTAYTNTSAVPGQKYYYKIRAVDCWGKTSYFSTIKTFTCDCAKPQVTSISINADTGKPVLKWKAVEGATKYEIWRKIGKYGTYERVYTQKSTTYTNTSAVPGNNYYYKVRALCGDNTNASSVFSAEKSYYCDCAKPVTSLTINKDSGKPKLTWGKVSGAAKYEVWRSTSKNGTYKKMLTTSGTTYTNSTAVPGTNYYYKVKAICGKSVYGNSAFSTPKSYVCDCARPVVSISRNSSTGKPRLTWQAVEGASKYEIWRSTSKNGTYVRLYTQKSTTYTNTTAKAGKTYYYKVKAICGKSSYGNSAFSYIDSITSK